MHTAFNPMGVIDMAKDYIIDYGESSDKTQWYRLWKSGWIEQGGNILGGNTNYTLNLLKPFKNTSYQLLLSRIYDSGSNVYPCIVREKTIDTIRINGVSGNTESTDWYACGY